MYQVLSEAQKGATIMMGVMADEVDLGLDKTHAAHTSDSRDSRRVCHVECCAIAFDPDRHRGLWPRNFESTYIDDGRKYKNGPPKSEAQELSRINISSKQGIFSIKFVTIGVSHYGPHGLQQALYGQAIEHNKKVHIFLLYKYCAYKHFSQSIS